MRYGIIISLMDNGLDHALINLYICILKDSFLGGVEPLHPCAGSDKFAVL
jgi:hypothetical protein